MTMAQTKAQRNAARKAKRDAEKAAQNGAPTQEQAEAAVKAEASNREARTRVSDPEKDAEALRLRVEDELSWQQIADRLGWKYDTQAADAAKRANGGEKPPALKKAPARTPSAESILGSFKKLLEADKDAAGKVAAEVNQLVGA